MLRVQLNILAGYLYDQQISSTAGKSNIMISQNMVISTV